MWSFIIFVDFFDGSGDIFNVTNGETIVLVNYYTVSVFSLHTTSFDTNAHLIIEYHLIVLKKFFFDILQSSGGI